MYIPSHFLETDLEKISQFIKTHPLGLMVANVDGIPIENAFTIFFLCSDAICSNKVFGLPKPPKTAMKKLLKKLNQLTKAEK
jgi:hypothetical protein